MHNIYYYSYIPTDKYFLLISPLAGVDVMIIISFFAVPFADICRTSDTAGCYTYFQIVFISHFIARTHTHTNFLYCLISHEYWHQSYYPVTVVDVLLFPCHSFRRRSNSSDSYNYCINYKLHMCDQHSLPLNLPCDSAKENTVMF